MLEQVLLVVAGLEMRSSSKKEKDTKKKQRQHFQMLQLISYNRENHGVHAGKKGINSNSS